MESINDGLLVVSGNGIISHHNSGFREMWTIPEGLMASRDTEGVIDYVKPKFRDS
jgi:hypothetical protein